MNIEIRNGRIFDGTGNPWFSTNIYLQNGKIAHIGSKWTDEIEVSLDATGLAITPGWIDIHAHSDFTILTYPLAESKIRQGVTTEAIGHCGFSAAPLTDEVAEYLENERSLLVSGDIDITWRTMKEYCDVLTKKGVAINIAPFCGHSTIRQNVLGFENRQPSTEELEQMKTFVREAMEQGAFGLSAGLFYAPGIYAKTDELIELCRVVHEYRGIYTIHLRNEGDEVIEAVTETIEIGRQSGIPVQHSHLEVCGQENWGKMGEVLKLIENARKEGIEYTADVSPWASTGTGLMAGLPDWCHEGGVKQLLERLKDPETRTKIKHQIEVGRPGWENMLGAAGLENVLLVGYPQDRTLQGKRITEIAEDWGKNPLDTVLDLLLEAGERNVSNVSIVLFDVHEQDVIRGLQHPITCISSDGSAVASEGPFGQQSTHPRVYGTYPQALGYFVREKKVLSLQEAIRKMTSLPAQKLGLGDRGILRENFVADLVIFDPQTIENRATYLQPHQYPIGIEYVIVNGEIVLDKGEHTQKRSGQVLKYIKPSQ